MSRNALTMAALTCASALAIAGSGGIAGPITPGNVVLYRVGDGAGVLSTNATPVFLDEYSPTGSLVQSIALPTAGTLALTSTGTIGLEGVMSLSQDKNLIVFGGYRKDVGGANPSTDLPTTTPRVVGTLDRNGFFDLTTMLDDVTGVHRSATTTDGSVMYVAGQAGLRRVLNPYDAGSTTLINTRNTRQGVLSNNVLYGSNGVASTNVKVHGWGTLPAVAVSNAEASSIVTLTTADFVQGISFVDLNPSIPGDDTLYLTSTNVGALMKYTFDGTSWTETGSIPTAGQNLTATVAPGGDVHIYLTNGTGIGGTFTSLFSFTDSSGYGGILSGSIGAAIADSPTNTAFRGLAVFPPLSSGIGEWVSPVSGNWSIGTNWSGGVPNATGAAALFGSAITSPIDVTLDIDVTVGEISFANTSSYTIIGGNTLTLQGTAGATIEVASGSHEIAAPVHLVDAVTVNSTAAASSITLSGDMSAGSGSSLTKTGAGELAVKHLRVDQVNIEGNRISVIRGASANEPDRVSRVSGISIAGGATPSAVLDLDNNSMVVDHDGDSPRAALETLIALGRSSGLGLVSTHPATAANSAALGIADASEVGISQFLGQSVDGTTTLIRFTRMGDANLDGVTDIGDFAALAANFNLPGRWRTGDFDYSGTTGIGDFALLAANFNQSLSGDAFRTPVPEPSMVAVLFALLGACLTSRRRSR